MIDEWYTVTDTNTKAAQEIVRLNNLNTPICSLVRYLDTCIKCICFFVCFNLLAIVLQLQTDSINCL